MRIFHWVCLAVGGVLTAVSLFARRRAVRALVGVETPTKQQKRGKTGWTVLLIAGGWLLTVSLLTLLFGTHESEPLTVEIAAPRVDLFGLSLSVTVLASWILMAVLLVLAVLIRFLVVPRMTDTPKGLQNLLEIAVETVAKYTDDRVPHSTGLGAYIFTIAVYMIGCAAVELFGVRAPTSDLTMTFGMSLITFVLINVFGIRRKGLSGRIKSIAYPTPVVFPFKIISDLAVPLSLACRLFGNMLGGMIVMELLYLAMGNLAVGVPSILGLYFNVFHPLIQAFIFVTLTLTFIGEAVENPE